QINNPLAVVLSSVSIMRQFAKDGLFDGIETKCESIEVAVLESEEALKKLSTIVEPAVSEYADGIGMINVAESFSDPSPKQGEFLEKYDQLLQRMRQDADLKSGYEVSRTESIADIGSILGERMGLSEEQLEDLRMLCLWHDVGVEAIDEKILRKPTELTDREMMNIKEHPKISEALLKPLHKKKSFLDLIRHHHEDMNGEGYPDKMSGLSLPLSIRIHRVVEAYVAMRSQRPFRAAMTLQEAQDELLRCSGLQFDPAVVKQFIDLLRERPEINELCFPDKLP
ncbi:HD domain-containing protein, partial [bacterium]|nr:HD domain-containing protein [bacterium]